MRISKEGRSGQSSAHVAVIPGMASASCEHPERRWRWRRGNWKDPRRRDPSSRSRWSRRALQLLELRRRQPLVTRHARVEHAADRVRRIEEHRRACPSRSSSWRSTGIGRRAIWLSGPVGSRVAPGAPAAARARRLEPGEARRCRRRSRSRLRIRPITNNAGAAKITLEGSVASSPTEDGMGSTSQTSSTRNRSGWRA